jgi:hypothetical protein
MKNPLKAGFAFSLVSQVETDRLLAMALWSSSLRVPPLVVSVGHKPPNGGWNQLSSQEYYHITVIS